MKTMLLSATLMSALMLTACGTTHDNDHTRHDRHDAREHRHHDKDHHRPHHQRTDKMPLMANADQVRNCQFLSDVNATWGQSNRQGMTDRDAAMRELHMRASRMGATHIVMEPHRTMSGDMHERARAYRCDKR